MCMQNLKFITLTVPEIIAIGVLGGVANPNHGEVEAVGVRDFYSWKEHC